MPTSIAPESEEEIQSRALEAATKYESRLNSISKVARFAAWFLKQELAWHDVKDEPPHQMMVLLRDTTHHIVRVGWLALDGWHFEAGSEKHFTPMKWQRIHF